MGFHVMCLVFYVIEVKEPCHKVIHQFQFQFSSIVALSFYEERQTKYFSTTKEPNTGDGRIFDKE